MKEARIIKLTGGLYTVVDSFGNKQELRPLGILRHHNVKPKVGDFVHIDAESIVDVMPRKNDFTRPQIANVDHVLLIMSVKEPEFSLLLLDRFLVLIQKEAVEPIIIVTKVDLASPSEMAEIKRQLDYYAKYYPVVYTSSKTDFGIPALKTLTAGTINVVAGQTGAGKSSLLNAINPELDLATDVISKALGRGKHTTRHVELIPFDQGWIADTPGFSKLEFDQFEIAELKRLYPDFHAVADDCRFRECSHMHEPGCAVKAAVDNHRILKERYENYRKLYDEISAIKTKYPR